MRVTLGQLLITLSMLQRLPAGLRGCSTDGHQLNSVLEQWATRLLGLCHLSGDQALVWSPGPSGHCQPSSPAPWGWLTQEMRTQGAWTLLKTLRESPWAWKSSKLGSHVCRSPLNAW